MAAGGNARRSVPDRSTHPPPPPAPSCRTASARWRRRGCRRARSASSIAPRSTRKRTEAEPFGPLTSPSMCVMAMNALYRPLTLARGENRQSAVKRAFLALALAGVAACERAKEPPPPPPTRPAATQKTAGPKPTEAQPAKPPTTPPVARDLDAIRQSGELRVLFTFNSTGYFIYRGEVMGYEYDLLNLFAHELHLRLRPVVIRDSAQLFEKLNRGEGDIVAAQLAVGAKPVDVAVTESLYSTSPVVVQRQNESPSAGTTP